MRLYRYGPVLIAALSISISACSSPPAAATTSPPAPAETTAPTTAAAPTPTHRPRPTIEPTATPVATNAPDIFPILEGRLILGGWRDGRWLDAQATARLIPRPVHYHLFSGGSPSGEADLAYIPGLGGACLAPDFLVNDDGQKGRKGPAVFGISGGWDPAPRKPQALGLDNPEYVSAVREALAEKGHPDADVQLSAVTRIDLDGDGADEVLVTANHLSGMRPDGTFDHGVTAGDYEVVLVRMLVDNQVRTFPLTVRVFEQTDETSQPDIPRIAATLDLNGDGSLEIVLDSDSYEGGQTFVYEVTPGAVTNVLSAGCDV